MKKKSSPPKDNPMQDSWRPADKAAEAAIDNPSEFRPEVATESARGPTTNTVIREHLGKKPESPDEFERHSETSFPKP